MLRHSLPVLFLKATIKKTILVPGYTRKDGTYVPPHEKSVHFDPDKSVKDVLSGNGSHSQKEAHKKLSKLPHWHTLSEDDQHAHLLSSATNIQNKKSASAALSGWKASMLAGEKPKPAHQAAFDAQPKDKQAAMLALVGKGGGAEGDNVAKKTKTATELAESKLDALSDDGDDDPAVESDAIFPSGVLHGFQVQVPESAYVLTQINPNLLTASQGGVYKAGVKHNLSGGSGSEIPVTAVELPDGKIVIQDGHHRVAAAILLGKKSIPVRVAKAESYSFDDETGVYSVGGWVPAALPLSDVPAFDHVVNVGKKAGGDQLAVMAASQSWLQANPGKDDELSSALVDAGYMMVAKQLGIYKPPGLPSHDEQIAKFKAEIDEDAKAGNMTGLSVMADEATHGYPEVAEHAQKAIATIKLSELVAGTGGHYPVKAAKKLHGTADWNDAQPIQTLEKVVALAKKMQAEASASAAVSGHKASILAGKVPTPAQTEAFLGMSVDKKQAHINALIDAKGSSHVVGLHNAGLKAHQEKKDKEAGKSAPAEPKIVFTKPANAEPKVEPVVSPEDSAASAPVQEKKPAEKPAKVPPSVKKLQAIDPAEVDAWLDAGAGKADANAKFWGLIPKPAQTKFLKWNNSAKKPGVADHWKKAFRCASIASLFGQYDMALLGDGTWKPVSSVTVGDTDNIVTDSEKIKEAAIAAKLAEKTPSTEGTKALTQAQVASVGKFAHNAVANKAKAAAKSGDGKAIAEAYFSALDVGYTHTADLISKLATLMGVPLTPPDAGPKEGETKEGADGTLVFHDGRWHKQAEKQKDALGSGFTNTTPGHNKFWTVSVVGTKVVTHYGKIGTKGSVTVKQCYTDAGAVNFKNQKMAEKKAGGYEFIGETSIPGDLLPAKQATPAPKVAKVEPVPPKPAAPTSGGIEAMDTWKQTGGQEGYNDGGTFVDEDGVAWYCKFPKSEAIVKNELLATKLYAAAGVSVPEVKLITKGGKVGIASKIIVGAAKDKAKLTAGKAQGLLSGFGADAWLANWDVVGNNPASGKGWDNIVFVGDVAHRIDAGGALVYGGAGGAKTAFGDEVIELKTMLDPGINSRTAEVFGKMGPADIAASVAKVLAIPESTIKALVDEFGPGSASEKAKLAAKLINRQADMAFKFPKVAAKAKKAAPEVRAKESPKDWVNLKPGEEIVESGEEFGVQFVKIKVPPAGFNVAGIPKPFVYDKSSSKFVNEANTADIKRIYDAAIAGGSVESLQQIKFEQIVKATGEKTGKLITVDEHPSSAYLKEYHAQVMAEIKAQLEPTYRIEHNGSFAASYSTAALSIAKKVKRVAYEKFKAWKDKAADYLVLDRKVGVSIPTPKPGQFHDVEYNSPEVAAFKKASDAKYEKLSASEKSALKSYTGSAYYDWNSALRLGDVGSSAFAGSKPMRDAFDKAAVELPEGIILHRGVNVGGDTYKSIMGAVIQDGSFQSASYGSQAAFSGKSAQLRLHIGRGVKGMMATSFSHFKTSEREIVLDRNCRYLVMNVTTKNGKAHVDVLVIPHED